MSGYTQPRHPANPVPPSLRISAVDRATPILAQLGMTMEEVARAFMGVAPGPPPPRPREVLCPYCRAVLAGDRCTNCGAPRTSARLAPPPLPPAPGPVEVR